MERYSENRLESILEEFKFSCNSSKTVEIAELSIKAHNAYKENNKTTLEECEKRINNLVVSIF